MKKIYSMMAAMLMGGVLFAQRNVTIQVDMAGQTISANGVHVAGSFQGPAGGTNWTPGGTPMTQVGTTTVYAATVTIPDSVYELKFINGNDWPGVEGVPAACQVSMGLGLGNGNDNRWMVINSDTTLPAIQFGGCAPAGKVAVTFALDMSLQTAIDDTVSVAGDFQGWSPGSSIMYDVVSGADSVYRLVHFMDAGDTVFYKYVNGTNWNLAEGVPSACNFGGNRRYIAGTTSAVAGINCFATCGACFIPDTFNVTIQVDMNGVCGFDDSLDIAGPFNGFNGNFNPDYEMTDANNDGIFEFTIRAASPELEYKARFHKNGTNWEGGNNKIINFSKDTIVAVRCFGNDAYGACAAVPDPSDLTFMVDVSQDPNFIPSASGIWMIADFTVPAWQGGAILMDPHPSLPGVFQTTVTDICPGKINFKFVNGDPNNGGAEEDFYLATDSSCIEPSGAGGYNRFYVRPNDQPQTIKAIYNTCQSNIGLEEAFANKTFSIYPNPFSGTTTLSLDANETYTVRVIDLSGRVLNTLHNVSGDVSINAEKLVTGVYMIQVENKGGELNMSRVVVQ
jgi:hypothetical protein